MREPLRVRQRNLEVWQRIARWRARREGESVRVSRNSAQHSVDQSGSTGLACTSGHRDGIVHGSCGRHTVEVEKLIHAESQDVQHLEIELRNRTLRKVLD